MANFFKKIARIVGPGVVTGASDDDPSGIATYSMSGAQFGLGLLWTSLLTTPLMIAVQELCARIGMVAGRGLVAVLKKRFSRRFLYLCVFLLVFANTVNIGADIGAMAASLQLVVGGSFMWLALGMTILTIALEVFLDYKTYAKYLKFLTLSLFAYIAVAFFIDIDWKSVFINLVIPSGSFTNSFFMMFTAIMGTTISPYLFFWQASQEVEEEGAIGRKTIAMRQGATKGEVSRMRIDTVAGMVFSNVVMFFIIVVAAMTFAKNGIYNIETAQQAAEMLVPIAGKYASWVFAAGIIGTGLLAIPVLSGSAAFAFSELFGMRRGLNLKYYQAPGFYGVIVAALVIGLGLNFLGINPVSMLFYSALLNGLIAPILLVFIFLIGNDEKIMGKWVSSSISNVMLWLTILILGFSGVYVVWGWIFGA